VTTGQVTKQTAAADVNAFETRDFYLACFLRCTGYALINLRPEGRHKVFVFKDQPARPADVIEHSTVMPQPCLRWLFLQPLKT
jgi:hypothetical protein